VIDISNEPIYRCDNGSYVIQSPWGPYNVCSKDVDPVGKYSIYEVEAYIATHQGALITEPVPPPPTPEDLAARRKAEIAAELEALDTRAIRPMRAKLAGKATVVDEEMIAECDTRADLLRAELAEL